MMNLPWRMFPAKATTKDRLDAGDSIIIHSERSTDPFLADSSGWDEFPWTEVTEVTEGKIDRDFYHGKCMKHGFFGLKTGVDCIATKKSFAKWLSH